MSFPIKFDDVFRNLSRILRYLMPGLLIVVLWELSLNNAGNRLPKLRIDMLLAYAIVLGPTYYGIHRVLFWLFDDILFSQYNTDCWMFFKRRYAPGNKKRDSVVEYMEYRWSILHYCLMTSELGILFSLLCSKCSLIGKNNWVLLVSIGLFFIFFAKYIHLSIIELKDLKFNRKNTWFSKILDFFGL